MRPALKPGLLPVWRDRDTLQIGVDPRRAIALSGMRAAAALIPLLDGTRNREQVIKAAAADGVPAARAERVLTVLAASGALEDYPASLLSALPAPLRPRLTAELATASLAHRDGDGGVRAIARRRAAAVRISGERRIGKAIARILAASGVGQVTASSSPGDGGCQRAGGRAGERVGGSAATRADLLILVGTQPPERADQLVRDRIPHLAVRAAEAIGVVGPLVVPGLTACLRCLDYLRAGHDPAWPLILAQLAGRQPQTAACDAALTAAVAAQAAMQALVAIDRSPLASAAANGTLELVLPGWQWRRRSWPRHPACLCSRHPGR